ncbi:MAG: DUF975 family protein [Verrucomicrobiota bacterium]
MNWYYEINRQQKGPVEESDLKALFDRGEINTNNFVWCKGMEDWATYGSVFQPAAQPTSNSTIEVKGTGGKTPNRQLRAQARQSLSGNWLLAALGLFLWQIVLGATNIVPLLGPLIQLAISGAMMLGLYGFFIHMSRGGGADIGELFQGFSQFWPMMGVYLLTGFIVVVASLASAAPGIALLVSLEANSPVPIEQDPMFIVAVLLLAVPTILVSTWLTLRYSLVYFIAFDEPGLGVMATIRQSVLMMKGQKMKLFFLGLSFIGWFVLGLLAFFIGLFFSFAYMFSAFTAFYEDLRES